MEHGFLFLYADIDGSGLLPIEAENQWKLVVTTELGGGEGVSASIHRTAQSGLRNVLIHVGLLKGVEQSRESLGKLPTILAQALDRNDYLLAPESGIFEIGVDPGQMVKVSECIGAIHHLERADRMPEPILARSAGYLITARVTCLTQQGDCVAEIARQVGIEEVLTV